MKDIFKRRSTFECIFLLQVFTIFLIFFDYLDPIFQGFRWIIFFINFLILPGFLFLEIIRREVSDFIDVILFSIGISLFFMISIGLLLSALSNLNISISLWNVIIVYEVLICSFSVILFLRKPLDLSNFNPFEHVHGIIKKNIVNRNVLLCILFATILILFSIIGTKYLNFSENSSILVFLDIFILLIILFVAIKSDFNSNCYVILLFGVALALLFQHSLLTNFPVGEDIYSEYISSQITLTNGFWNPSIANQTNSAIGSVLLAPILSILFNVDLFVVFKVIFPLIFSLIVVCLYQSYRTQFSDKLAFFSVIYFVVFFSFFDLMISLPRQSIAEFFLALILLIIVKYEKDTDILLLLTIFSFALIFSHYSLAFIFAIILLAQIPFIKLFKKLLEWSKKWELKSSIFSRHNLFRDVYSMKNRNFITVIYVVIFLSFTILWYAIITDTSFNNATHFTDMFFKEIFAPKDQGIQSVALNPQAMVKISHLTLFQEMKKYLNLFGYIMAPIGMLIYLIDKKIAKNREYFLMALVALVLMVTSLFVSFVAAAINVYRFIHIILIFISPFVIYGIYELIKGGLNFTPQKIRKISTPVAWSLIGLFCVFLLLLNVGLAYQFSEDQPTSYSLSGFKRMNYATYSDTEFQGMKWLDHFDNNIPIYGDGDLLETKSRLSSSTNWKQFSDNLNFNSNSVIIYRNSNIIYNSIFSRWGTQVLNNNAVKLVSNKSEVYDNRGSRIFV